jgi:hypothetical protein
MKPPALMTSLAKLPLEDVPETCYELVEAVITSAAHPNPVFRELLSPRLAQMTEQARVWSHGELVYESTESWRTAYQAVLASPLVKDYHSVAWVKTEDYWQDLPGQRAMQINYALLDRGVRIERLLVLGWNLWPPELDLPLAVIRTWIEEQHYRGIDIWLVRESDLVGERGLLCDFGIYGDTATGKQELDSASRTICFSLSFDPAAIQLAQDRWARLLLFARTYSQLLDQNLTAG